MKSGTVDGINRLAVACAFTEACNKAKVEHKVRIDILRKAGGLSGLSRFLESSEQCAIIQDLFLAYYNVFDPRGKTDIQAVTIVDNDYPILLKEISHPPAILFWKGIDLAPLSGPRVIAVVGSRHPSVYGLEVTRRLVSGLARRGVPIVSGGARGIDGEAHRVALHEDGLTFCVLGCGVDVVYPAEHRKLFAQIIEKGALISEFLPGRKPLRHFFPARNRIISGICHAVLVTEASKASGTLITAGFAADQGRDVCAVPGSIIAGSSHSCHQLIREGAILVESLHDIPGLSEVSPSSSSFIAQQHYHMLSKKEEPALESVTTIQGTGYRREIAPGREALQVPVSLIGQKMSQKSKNTQGRTTFHTPRTSSVHKATQIGGVNTRTDRTSQMRSPDVQKLLDVLDAAPRSLSLLAEICQYSSRKTALILSELQCEGVVRLHRGLYQRVHS